MPELLRRIATAGVKKLVNWHYARYGNMTELKIDKDNRRITMTLLLKGEREPIEVVLQDYELATSDNQVTLKFKNVTVSREWMAVLAEQFLKDRALPLGLPSAAANALRLVL